MGREAVPAHQSVAAEVEQVGDLDDAVLDAAGQSDDLARASCAAGEDVEVDDEVDARGDRGDDEATGHVLDYYLHIEVPFGGKPRGQCLMDTMFTMSMTTVHKLPQSRTTDVQ